MNSPPSPSEEIAKNLAANYRDGHDIRPQIAEFGNESTDHRWQHAFDADLRSWEGVFYILTGCRANSAFGYTWA